jgi:hypothetical protein
MIDKNKKASDLDIATQAAKKFLNDDGVETIHVVLPEQGVYINSDFEVVSEYATRTKQRLIEVPVEGKEIKKPKKNK